MSRGVYSQRGIWLFYELSRLDYTINDFPDTGFLKWTTFFLCQALHLLKKVVLLNLIVFHPNITVVIYDPNLILIIIFFQTEFIAILSHVQLIGFVIFIINVRVAVT